MYVFGESYTVRAKKIIFIVKGIFPLDEGIFTVAFSFSFPFTIHCNN